MPIDAIPRALIARLFELDERTLAKYLATGFTGQRRTQRKCEIAVGAARAFLRAAEDVRLP